MKTIFHLLFAGLVLGLIQSVWAQPIITIQPQNQTVLMGTTATFTVSVTGLEPLRHQWRFHPTPTTFTNLLFGTEATLTLTNVQPPTRRYSVVVTDAVGLSATSSPLVILTVLGITSQPTDQIVEVGATAAFAVAATSAASLAYQWHFNDTNLVGKTTASLMLANAQWTNVGRYSVVVTYTLGSITSRVARLAFPAHRFERIAMNPDHTISLSLAGDVPSLFAPYYDIYRIEVSTNLVNWSPLAILQRTNSSLDALSHLDPNATDFDQRYYRTHTNILITPLPKPSGPYPVGTVSRLLTDPSRSNRYNIPTNSSFMVTFWYPAEARAGVLQEAYVESNATLYAYLNERNPGLVPRFLSHALPGLPVATNQVKYPLVIYSHGGGFRRQNTDKAVELASHGYVVVAADHIWATASVLPNGQVASPTAGCAATHACFQPTLDSGIKDLQFVSDELSRLNTSDVLFGGRLDMERLGAFGFSLGTVMVAEFCRIDARCKAVVLLDCGPTLDLSTNLAQLGLQKPFLSINNQISVGPVPPTILGRPLPIPGSAEWLAASRSLFSNAVNNVIWFQLQGAGHQSFQDRGTLISDPSLTVDPTPASRSHSGTIRASTLSFFDKYLKGEDDHLLDNPTTVYTNIINFQRK